MMQKSSKSIGFSLFWTILLLLWTILSCRLAIPYYLCTMNLTKANNSMKKEILIGVFAAGLMVSTATAKDIRSIKSVETVCVEVPVGNAPRLPYRLWVKYSDGKGEYSQVKWLNSSEATEKAEANPELSPMVTI